MGLVKHLLRSRGTEKNRRRSRYHNQDQGGVYSAPEDSIYYLGIIDILQKWNTRKKAECSIKRVREHVCFGPCLFLANVLNELRCTHSLCFFYSVALCISCFKQVRHFSMVVEPTFSCVAPKTYRNRFIKFLDKGVFMKEETAEEEEVRNQAQKNTKKKKK